MRRRPFADSTHEEIKMSESTDSRPSDASQVFGVVLGWKRRCTHLPGDPVSGVRAIEARGLDPPIALRSRSRS